MTQEERELLFKDLCARLPYNIAIDCRDEDSRFTCYLTTDILREIQNNTYHWEYKPYLFPLSSMPEEQYEKFIIISGWDVDIEDVKIGKFSCIGYVGLDCIHNAIDWFNKNHFDYRGLIKKGLAIDATGLSIYN